jgi:CHAT domain-containing protein
VKPALDRSVKILKENMPKPIFPSLIALICLLFAGHSVVYSQETPKLVLNQAIEREIKGGEIHLFAVQIGANQTARVEIEQKSTDVSLAAYKPSGERFIETESPSGMQGSDLILVTAIDAGEYKVEISPADPRSSAGKYTVKLTEIRPTVVQDGEINAAAAKITRLANETVSLRQNGTREGRRQAIDKFREIIALSKIKQDKIWEVVALISIGLISEQLGEIQNALNFDQQGLTLARATGNRQYEGTALNNLAINYNVIGEYQTAIFYLNQALNLQRETGNRRGEAINLNNLGMSHLLLGDLPKAADYFQNSLVLRGEVKDQRGEATTLNNLGNIFMQSSDFPKAIDFLQQSLTLRQTIGDKAGEAISLRNLGKAFWASGDKTKGFGYFEEANTLARQLGDRRVEADSFYWLAVAEKDRENLPKAIEDIESGLQLIEQIRGELINPELRITYFSTVQDFYELYTDLLVARFEKSKTAADRELALQISERARTRSLVELLQEARINIKQGVDEKLIEREIDLQDSLNAKYRQRTAALSGKQTTPEQISKLTNEINSVTTELEKLEVQIRRENPRYADLKQTETLSAQGIQNLLDGETVLLEYKLGTTRSFLWLVTNNSTEIFILPPRKEIETAAKDFYNSIVSRDQKNQAKTIELSKKLSAILLSPVADKIVGKRTAIVADGILQYIPFASLQVSGSKFQVPGSLVENNEIVVLPSANVLAEIRRNSVDSKPPAKALSIFADAVFEATDTRLSAFTKNIDAAEKPTDLGRSLRDVDLSGSFPRLLSSRVEARNISAFVAKTEVDLNIDFDASRENVTEKNLMGFRILHFATHGLLDTAHPEFSGLVLSLFDKNGKPQDGFLRLNQIYNLNLNSDLVVLSACQTALGKDVRGEGLIGLTRGFMYAGAKRIVSSLWKVDDAATAEFMKHFYQNLLQKKLAPPAALRAAQMEMKQIPRFRAAYFWAGFTIQGEWK